MRTRMAATAGTLTVAIGLLAAAPAEALRCGQRLIAEGDHSSKLLRFCGEPISIQPMLAKRLYVGELHTAFFPGVLTQVSVEEWTYNFGPNRFMRVVRMENDIVTEIRALGYGFVPR